MQFIDIHNTDILFIASKIYSGQNKVTVFVVLHFVNGFVWYQSVFTQYSYYRDFFYLGPASHICDHHRHVWVCYFDTTKIMVWFMSSILIHMTYFSVYTICISEHYRAIFGYSPTSGQQVGTILWNITIIFLFRSQIYRVTFFFFRAWSFYLKKYRITLPSPYFVVPGASVWTAGSFEELADFQWILHDITILSGK